MPATIEQQAVIDAVRETPTNEEHVLQRLTVGGQLGDDDPVRGDHPADLLAGAVGHHDRAVAGSLDLRPVCAQQLGEPRDVRPGDTHARRCAGPSARPAAPAAPTGRG